MKQVAKWYAVYLPYQSYGYSFLFTQWDECKELVNGAKNARYKRFFNQQDAQSFLIECFSTTGHKSALSSALPKEMQPWSKHFFFPFSAENIIKKEKNIIEIYTDGSFLNNYPGHSGWGFVAIEDNKIKKEEYGTTDDESKSRNIAGELHAVLNALKWFRDYNASSQKNIKAQIFHDYAGISHWAHGSWKAKKTISIWYQREVNRLISGNSVSFTKVAAHSGNKWNEHVDLSTRTHLQKAFKEKKLQPIDRTHERNDHLFS